DHPYPPPGACVDPAYADAHRGSEVRQPQGQGYQQQAKHAVTVPITSQQAPDTRPRAPGSVILAWADAEHDRQLPVICGCDLGSWFLPRSCCTDSLLAKEVAAACGPAVAQARSAAGCSVNDRDSPWVTLLTGMWRARATLMAVS